MHPRVQLAEGESRPKKRIIWIRGKEEGLRFNLEGGVMKSLREELQKSWGEGY